MFNVGRYDPKRDKQKWVKEDDRVELKKRKNKNSKSKQAVYLENVKEQSRKKQQKVDPDEEQLKEKKLKLESDTHSTSSSSVPSEFSSEEDENSHDKIDDEPQSTLRVIAPEQKFLSTKKLKSLPDEALDDFDIEESESLDEDAADQDNDEDPTEHEKRKEDKNIQRHTKKLMMNQQEVETALRMSNLPIHEAAATWDLSPFLVTNLKNDGYEHFFPIQSLVIPDVIATERSAHIRARDVCVSAPTGSGKTLAFVLPVLNALSKRTVRRLRALVVLPTRDLASQVFTVFERYAQGSPLKIGLSIGQTDFRTEQRDLVLDPSHRFRHVNAAIAHKLNPTDVYSALIAHSSLDYSKLNHNQQDNDEPFSIPRAGISAVDVLVATPGRLLNHLDKTPGFTLQHLQFLIIDEADRLLNQSYQNWIQKVHMAADFSRKYNDSSNSLTEPKDLQLSHDGVSFNIDPFTYRKNESKTCALLQPVNRAVQLRKFLFSATLTKDPQKLSSLGLVHPKHFDAHRLKVTKGQMTVPEARVKKNQQYSLPERLDEYSVQCSAQQKPIVLLGLVLQELTTLKDNIIVVFTVSLEATHRLTRLLQLLWGSANYGSTNVIAEFSSSLNHKQRSNLLERCSNGEVSVVVCSDGMSRGLDIPSVGAVINYDVPGYAKTYVHRCGRTARAGRSGKAISILKPGQVKQFENMRGMIDKMQNVKRVGVRKDDVKEALQLYPGCLKRLKEVIEAEKEKALDNVSALSDNWLVLPKPTQDVEDEDDVSVSSSSVPSSDESEESIISSES